MKGKIFEIKRFAVHDGDGIRTTVFFKGCPLKCVWCHNPEGIDFKPQLAYYKNKCISCGECTKVCPSGAHIISENGHIFNREKCLLCGACENVCLGDALKFYGKEMTVDELLPILLEDKEFFDNSGGGITLSGGECLMQADFCAELLKALKQNGIHTAVDTCGFVNRESIDKVLPYTDVFLYDLKAINSEVHAKCTGMPNEIILENLRYIDAAGKRIEIRFPYVPGFNSGETEEIAAFVSKLKNISGIKVLPYHNYAKSKYESLDMEENMPPDLPTQAEIENAEFIMKGI